MEGREILILAFLMGIRCRLFNLGPLKSKNSMGRIM
jgi:hypothetical protein